MKQVSKEEFNNLIEEYIAHPKFQELKDCPHHGITRFAHSFSVAYNTYKITKFLHLDYISATKAAILHDFFTNEVETQNSFFRLTNHPKCAARNAEKYFGITEKEKDMIKCHMFPVTITPPKYLEGWIIDIVDDAVAIKERSYVAKKAYLYLKRLVAFLLIMILK